MKLRRIFAAIAACAVAATMAISASAESVLKSYDKPGTVTISNVKLLDKDGKEVAAGTRTVTIKGQPDMTMGATKEEQDKISKNIGKPDPAGKTAVTLEDLGIDPTTVEGKSVAKITVDVQVDSGYCNGCLGANLDGKWAQSDQIENPDDKVKAWEWAIEGKLDAASFQVQIWWINPFATYEDTESTTGTSSTTTTTTSSTTSTGAAGGTTNPTTGATAGLALAGLAIAGAAVVAAKKSK